MSGVRCQLIQYLKKYTYTGSLDLTTKYKQVHSVEWWLVCRGRVPTCEHPDILRPYLQDALVDSKTLVLSNYRDTRYGRRHEFGPGDNVICLNHPVGNSYCSQGGQCIDRWTLPHRCRRCAEQEQYSELGGKSTKNTQSKIFLRTKRENVNNVHTMTFAALAIRSKTGAPEMYHIR